MTDTADLDLAKKGKGPETSDLARLFAVMLMTCEQ